MENKNQLLGCSTVANKVVVEEWSSRKGDKYCLLVDLKNNQKLAAVYDDNLLADILKMLSATK